VAFASGIIQAWAGPQGYAGMLTVTGLGLYGYLLSLVNSHATLLNGINATKRQVWIGWAEATANLVLSVILVGRLGVGGVALGTALASLLTVSWMLPLDLRTQTQGRVTFQVRPVVKHLATALVPGLAAAYGLQLLSIPQPLAWGLEGLVVVAYLSLSWWGLEQASRRLVTDLAARLMRRVGRGEPSPTASHTSG
jgi:O-antigen/teichoic acid export membrane protein